MSPQIQIRQLSSETWHDFSVLMQGDAQCSECWCLNHREPTGCATGLAAKEKMRELTAERRTRGLLAYSGLDCVGWLAVDPMAELVGHDCHSSGQLGEWAIHCVFVKDSFRGKGLATTLIQAGVLFAKEQGASIVSAFPIPEVNRCRFPANVAEFSGRYSTFSKLGFRPEGEASEFYQRMELEV